MRAAALATSLSLSVTLRRACSKVSIGTHIAKSLPHLSPPESRTLVTHVGEPGVLGGFLGIDDHFGGA